MYRVLTALLVLILIAGDIGARGYRSSSFGGSRSSSRSYSSPSRSTSTRRSSSTSFSKKSSSTTADKATTVKKASTTSKPKAVAATKTSKALQKKNATAAKKYGNKSTAAKAYRQENKAKLESLASKKYDKQPETRPEHIPAQYSGPNGASYPTVYNGGYYGYYDPAGAFIRYAAMDMLVTSAMLRSAGYGHYNAAGQPVVVHSNGSSVIAWIVGIVVALVLIIAIAVMASA